MNKKKIKAQLYEETDGRCAYCGDALLEHWQIDHIDPVDRSGRSKLSKSVLNDYQNMIASCPRCNRWKKNRNPEEFKKYLKSYEG